MTVGKVDGTDKMRAARVVAWKACTAMRRRRERGRGRGWWRRRLMAESRQGGSIFLTAI